ncbi:MAG: phosphoribosylglycinamide formyltransferase, partial [Thermodesulfobacteriota bacterium]|nr:phosphoribosylglycinamide formyltransferase [Thermodesulfobacteriota bacterium]
MKKINLGVLVSGSGSNLQAIIDNIESGKLDAIIRVVISNVSGVRALERAKTHNIPAVVVDHENFSTREESDREAVAILKSHSVDLVIMAGFMKILTPVFLRAFSGKIMNIHPALLPSFQGLHVQQKAFDYGVKFSGCTVHFADEGVDTGPIIIQAVVPVYSEDT